MAPQNESSASVASIPSASSKIEHANQVLDPKAAPEFEHPELEPVFPTETYKPLEVVEYEDRALKADPTLKNLLANATVKHLEPKIGTELSGIQLHELTDTQRDELALLVAQRGVVFLRDQELSIDQQADLGRYYGPLHIHQSIGIAQGRPEVHVVHNSVAKSDAFLKHKFAKEGDNDTWHSDVSYERQVCDIDCFLCLRVIAVTDTRNCLSYVQQPPSYTSLKLLTVPEVGGDTLWASSYEAYERLTPPFRAFVESLTAIHSSKESADDMYDSE
jgi:sulfonate dioxygenase